MFNFSFFLRHVETKNWAVLIFILVYLEWCDTKNLQYSCETSNSCTRWEKICHLLVIKL